MVCFRENQFSQRQGAHNWEGTGALSAQAALEALPGAVNAILGEDRYTNRRVDPTRVLFAGHSRGGHG